MKIAAKSNFKKLYGKIDKTIKKGKYTFKIEPTTAEINPIPKGSEIHLVLSTCNNFGGDNKNLGIVYITVGSLTILSSIFFSIRGFIFRKSDDYQSSS
jgi:hypothetical protein